MVIADYLDYETARTWDQGKSNQCTAYAFFTLLAEHVQQEKGIDVEFDFDKYFKEMESNRGTTMRVRYLCSKAMKDGYKTKCGKLVKIGSYVQFQAWRRLDFLCETIQAGNPMIFAVHQYEGHDLNPKDTDIIEMPTSDKKKKNGHAMTIRGFDYSGKMIKFQNSWKHNNIKWMPYDVFLKLCKYCFYIKNVTIK